MVRVLSLFLLILLLLAGCGRPAPSPSPAPLTVAAASDLQFAFQELGRLFEQQTGQPVVFTFGSTGNLARQIEHGAPVDLFAAANIAFVEDLVQKGRVEPQSIQRYARGRVTLAVNRASGASAVTLADLLDPRIKQVAIANPDHAPYGLAAKEALISAGIWEQIQPKLVYGENVRQALQFVQTGNAEAGIIALSVADVPEITHMLIDEALHRPLIQALGVVTGSAQAEGARAFARLLLTPEGLRIMNRYGFSPPEGG